LGPLIFADYAADIARRVGRLQPGAGAGGRSGDRNPDAHLRDRLPSSVRLTATDLNPPMLEIARTKFRPGEQVKLRPADATALAFADASFEAVVCQFGLMFFPDKNRSSREVYPVLAPGEPLLFNVWDSHRHNPFGGIAHEVIGRFFPGDPPQFQSVPFSYRFETAKDSLIDAAFADIANDEAAVPAAITLPWSTRARTKHETGAADPMSRGFCRGNHGRLQRHAPRTRANIRAPWREEQITQNIDGNQ
jgi:SAM-dependent methyltransferase